MALRPLSIVQIQAAAFGWQGFGGRVLASKGSVCSVLPSKAQISNAHDASVETLFAEGQQPRLLAFSATGWIENGIADLQYEFLVERRAECGAQPKIQPGLSNALKLHKLAKKERR